MPVRRVFVSLHCIIHSERKQIFHTRLGRQVYWLVPARTDLRLVKENEKCKKEIRICVRVFALSLWLFCVSLSTESEGSTQTNILAVNGQVLSTLRTSLVLFLGSKQSCNISRALESSATSPEKSTLPLVWAGQKRVLMTRPRRRWLHCELLFQLRTIYEFHSCHKREHKSHSTELRANTRVFEHLPLLNRPEPE